VRTFPKTVRATFRLEAPILAALREAADRENIAQAVIVEEGIRLALDRPLTHLPKKLQKLFSRQRTPSEKLLGRDQERMIEWRTNELAKSLPKALARKVAKEEFNAKQD